MKKLFYIIIIIFICFLSFILNKYNNRYYFISYGNYNENTNIIRKKTTLKKIIKDYKNYDYIKIDKIKKEKISMMNYAILLKIQIIIVLIIIYH